ncbi:MAG: hypothetical protein AB2541_15490, partial [Candidatus Thiodiazotropha sp.]
YCHIRVICLFQGPSKLFVTGCLQKLRKIDIIFSNFLRNISPLALFEWLLCTDGVEKKDYFVQLAPKFSELLLDFLAIS